MKKVIGCFVLVAAMTLTSGMRAQDTKSKDNTGTKDTKSKAFDDTEFVMMAASGGMHEVELGKLASKQAMNEKVKALGERMVQDHTKANEKLKAVAGEAGVKLPEKLMPDHQKHVDHFRAMKGADFDKEYISHMVKDHEHDVAMFRMASTEAKNKALASFAKETLPTLEEHLSMVRQLQSQGSGGTQDRSK
jgi:putative membrane protein